MRNYFKPAVYLSLCGLGFDIVGNSLAQTFPNAPHLVWVIIFWSGVLFTFALPVWLIASGASWIFVFVKRVGALETDYNRYVKPRDISEEQMNAAEQFLYGRPKCKGRIIFVAGDREANSFAGKIHRVFQRAHWRDVALTSAEPNATVDDGVSLNISHALSDKKDLTMDDVKRGLEKAGIVFDRCGSGGSQATTETHFVVAIGHRPRL